MNIKDIITVSLVLFSVIDILGSIPIIIDLKKKGFEIKSGKASIAAMAIMSLFLFTGEQLLGFFGVDVASFAIAGALIIFFLGLEMVLGITLFREDPGAKSGTLVPIAFPLIAGAGTMTTILSLKSKFSEWDIQAGIAINIVLVYLVLYFSDNIQERLGQSGAMVLRKLFGIILLAIAIKLVRENLSIDIKIENV